MDNSNKKTGLYIHIPFCVKKCNYCAFISFPADESPRAEYTDALINEIWGPYAGDNNRILRVNMANIRRKLEKNPAEPEYIFTELGVGYRMLEDEG